MQARDINLEVVKMVHKTMEMKGITKEERVDSDIQYSDDYM